MWLRQPGLLHPNGRVTLSAVGHQALREAWRFGPTQTQRTGPPGSASRLRLASGHDLRLIDLDVAGSLAAGPLGVLGLLDAHDISVVL